MTPANDRSSERSDAESAREDAPATIQLVVADEGNRRAIRSMLDAHHDVRTDRSIRDADLHLVEDRLLSRCRDGLLERAAENPSTFSPVVVIRRETTDLDRIWPDPLAHDDPALVDDVVDAPVDRDLLRRRIHSLLVRRRQSQTLTTQLATIERRQRELHRFERSFESSDNALALVDHAGTIEVANPALTELTGYAEADLVGESIRLFQPDGAAEMFDEDFWLTIDGRSRWSGEMVIERSDASRRVAEITISAIERDEADGSDFVLVLNDVTEHIQRERELEEREEQLDLLRQILTRYLRHNLRNDLNVVMGHAQRIDEHTSLSDARDSASAIVDRANQLLETNETARTYSNLLATESGLSPHDLSALVVDAAESVRERHPNVDFDVDVPESCTIRARDGVHVALEELIENAIQHNPADEPFVRIRVTQTGGARVDIEDDGPGIPDVELETLEVGEETPLRHSQGIGLWLSKWIIEGVDGRLSFDSTESGTRVSIEFPPPDELGTDGLDVPELTERDQRLEAVIERMTDAVVEVDADWEAVFLDRRAEEILDVDVDSVLDRDVWDAVPTLRDGRLEAVARRVMESRSTESVTDYFDDLDAWLEVSVYPEFDGGLSCYFRDVSDRRRRETELRNARERMELALDATGATVWEWDLESDRVTTHPDVHTAFGTAVETVAEFVQTVHPEDRDRVRSALEAAVESETGYHEEFRVRVDGEVRWVEDVGTVAERGEGDARKLLGINRDVTERVERESELKRQRDRLEEFASIVSHDLRNPLNVAQANLEMAREERDGGRLDGVQRGLDRIEALMEDLLALASDGAGVQALEDVSLDAVVSRSWETVETGAASLAVDTDAVVRADGSRLRQLFENLLGNAVDHGGDGVAVTVGALEDGFFLEDDGPGIPPDRRERVFESGFSTRPDGTGFGLTIVRRVADAHGWDVRVVEGSEGGARFELTGIAFVDR
jgi:PAS domain S-box-containing protein